MAGIVTVDQPIEDWHIVGASLEPVFQTNWRAVSGYQVGFYIDRWRDVHLRGLVERTGAAFTFPANLFTMPLGYRPLQSVHFASVGSDSANGFQAARLVVATNGVVTLQDPIGGAAAWARGVGSWISLDTVGFRAA